MRTPLELLSDGWHALVKELGPADALRYRALFLPGKGDYAMERESLFANVTLEDLEKALGDRWSGHGASRDASLP